MEDLDPPREQPGARQLILEQLSAHGLKSDLPVTYQSERIANYHSALDALRQQSLVFPVIAHVSTYHVTTLDFADLATSRTQH